VVKSTRETLLTRCVYEVVESMSVFTIVGLRTRRRA